MHILQSPMISYAACWSNTILDPMDEFSEYQADNTCILYHEHQESAEAWLVCMLIQLSSSLHLIMKHPTLTLHDV